MNFSLVYLPLQKEKIFQIVGFWWKKSKKALHSGILQNPLPTFLNSTDPDKFLREWVYKYLKYPEAALREGIQGRVMVDFIIEKDGKLTNARVTKGVSEEIDAEALKVVMASPKWKPGRVNGDKVRTSMSIPVEFRLEKKGKSSFGIKK